MQAAEGEVGRVFVLRLEHGDVIPDCIEEFAAREGVIVGCAMLVGGIGAGEIVVGPEDGEARPPTPMVHALDGAHEVAAVGVLAPGADGRPVLHMHGALGRASAVVGGCLRNGVKTWATGEVVLYEFKGVAAQRLADPEFGFALLQVGARAPEREAPAAGSGASAGVAGSQPVIPDDEERRPAAQFPARDGSTRILYLLNAELH